MAKRKKKKANHLYNDQPKIFSQHRKVIETSGILVGDEKAHVKLVEKFRWINEDGAEQIMFEVFDPVSTAQYVDNDEEPIWLGIRTDELPANVGLQ